MVLRTIRVGVLAASVVLTSWVSAAAQVDALPSWNDGAAKQAILDFVRKTTDAASTTYVLP